VLKKCLTGAAIVRDVRYGFEFLGYKIKRGYKKLYLPESKIRSQARQDALYAYPKAKSILVVSWTRYGSEPNGRCLCKPRS
jgi:hypothetical protein